MFKVLTTSVRTALILGLLTCLVSPMSQLAAADPLKTPDLSTLNSTLNSVANSSLGSSAQLVQSVPLETELSQPGVPMTADVWIDMIRGAKSSLDLAQFYVSAGGVKEERGGDKGKDQSKEKRALEPILQELEKAAKRGVRIRLLVSSTLLKEDPETLDRFKKMRGALVRVLNLSSISGGVLHAKYWIVDKKEVFVGSQNFDWRALTQIHELGVRVQDVDLARQLGRIFEADWRLVKNSDYSALGYYINNVTIPRRIELVASPPLLNPSDTRSAIQSLIELLNNAKKQVHIQLMEYAPLAGDQIYWAELDNALRSAAIRRVKISILLSSGPSASKVMDYLKSLTMLPGVEIKLVTLPQYSGGFIPYARVIHGKYMIVDGDVLWLGTSNWSKGYFYNSRNIELILRRPDLAQTAEQIFQRVWNSMYAVAINKAN